MSAHSPKAHTMNFPVVGLAQTLKRDPDRFMSARLRDPDRTSRHRTVDAVTGNWKRGSPVERARQHNATAIDY
jgi:hypothetical protein